MTLTIRQKQTAILEALGAERRYEKIGIRVGNIGGDHLARTKIEPKLYRDQNDRKKDADQRNGKANAIVQ